MLQSTLVKMLLAPISLLYGLGVSLRNAFYRAGLLKSMRFNIPVISVGNLSVGGAGKTPHIEYLIRLLKDHIHVATLSRGYGRRTRGFLEVQGRNNAEQVGDEPLQFKRKFPNIGVFVAENRAFAIPQLLMRRSATQMVLLDDAFQHRSVLPGVNILLTDHAKLFTQDYLLPSGRLREWRSAYERADVIIVSKCPLRMDTAERDQMIAEINPLPHQQVFFSYYGYQTPYYQFNSRYRLRLDKRTDVLLICAIAKTDYLVNYLESQAASVGRLEYADHHFFDRGDVSNLKRRFDQISNNRKVIITTEKDAMRLELHREFLIRERLPIFVLPTAVEFHFDQGEPFDEMIRQYLLNFKV